MFLPSSVCSMEMWCPDDIGRDSSDRVGPPTGERAWFNSPEWSGGSSPVKTEPLQIVLLLLFWTRRSTMSLRQRHRSINCAACDRTPGRQTPGVPGTSELSTTNNCWSSRAPKKKKSTPPQTPSEATLQVTPGQRTKNCQIRRLVGVVSNFQVRPAPERQLKHRLCTLLHSA